MVDSTAPAPDGAARGGLEACLRLQLAGAAEGARLLQVCVQDNSSNLARPHVHLQLHFSDSSRSQWVAADGTLAALREAIAEVCGARGQVRMHVHGAEKKKKKTARECARTMPVHVLTEEEVGLIDDPTCPICLDDLVAGDKIMVVPCGGLHKGHAKCLSRWLEIEAHTCPTCRHELPVDGAKTNNLVELRERAAREIWRLRSLALACADPPEGENCPCARKKSFATPAPYSRHAASASAAPAGSAAAPVGRAAHHPVPSSSQSPANGAGVAASARPSDDSEAEAARPTVWADGTARRLVGRWLRSFIHNGEVLSSKRGRSPCRAPRADRGGGEHSIA